MRELALTHDHLLYKVVAEKTTREYQLEFATIEGASYFGFVIGLDQDWVQLLSPGLHESRYDRKIAFNISLGDAANRIWIPISNISAVIENRLAIKNFDKPSQLKIRKEQAAFSSACVEWLKELEEDRKSRTVNEL